MNKKRPTNYKELFLFGNFMLIAGAAFIISDSFPRSIGLAFLAVGGLFLIEGLRHKDKWTAAKKKDIQEKN